MRDTFADLDRNTEAIRADEQRATATLAVIAWTRHEPMPTATPLQRTVARVVPRAYCDVALRQMRARAGI